MRNVIGMIFALVPLAACGEVTITNPRPATQYEVQQNQNFAPKFPVCLSVDGIQQVSRILTKDQMEGIAFVPQKDLPSGCKAENIPARDVIDIIGSLPDRDRDWQVPVAQLSIPEPLGSPFTPSVYGFALLPAQASLGRSQYRVNPGINCRPLVRGMTEREVRSWHKLCG